MLGLPQTTEVKKIIPKRALYSKFELNTAEQKEFDAAIRQITISTKFPYAQFLPCKSRSRKKQFLFWRYS